MANFQNRLQSIEKRRAALDALRQRSQQPYQQQMVGGRVVPMSTAEGLSRVASSVLPIFGERRLQKQESQIKEQQREAESDWLEGLQEAQTPSPLQPIGQTPGEKMDVPDVSGVEQPDVDRAQGIGPDISAGQLQQQAQGIRGQEASDMRQETLAQALRGQDISPTTAGIGQNILEQQFGATEYERVDLGDRIAVIEPSSGREVASLPKGVEPDTVIDTRIAEEDRDFEARQAELDRQAQEDRARIQAESQVSPAETARQSNIVDTYYEQKPTLETDVELTERAMELAREGDIDFGGIQQFALQALQDGGFGSSVLSDVIKTYGLSPDEQRFAAYLNRIALKMREPGSGSVSDFEQRMFQMAAGQGTWSQEAVIENLQGLKGEKQNRLDRLESEYRSLFPVEDTRSTGNGDNGDNGRIIPSSEDSPQGGQTIGTFDNPYEVTSAEDLDDIPNGSYVRHPRTGQVVQITGD